MGTQVRDLRTPMPGHGIRSPLLVGIAILAAAIHTQPALATTHIPNTTYTSNTTWTLAGSPYVLDGNVTVDGGATLTIEPGVIVKFGYVYAQARKLLIASGGALSAVGTGSQPITFTSIKDDAVGGDTGLDGPTTCNGGNGGYIEVQSASATNAIQHATIRCGPYPGFINAEVRVVGSGSTLSASDINVSLINGSGFYDSGGTLTLSRATIIGTKTHGVAIDGGGTASIEDSTLVGNYSATPCACRGIRVDDGAVTLQRTMLTDWWHAADFYLTSSFNGDASSLFDNTIRGNAQWGVYIGADLLVTALPYGERNNIYDNGGSDLNQNQFRGIYPSLAAPFTDWRNNYWGPGTHWVDNDARCAYPPLGDGYVAYEGSLPPNFILSPASFIVYKGIALPPPAPPPPDCVRHYVDLHFPSPTPFS